MKTECILKVQCVMFRVYLQNMAHMEQNMHYYAFISA